MEQLEQAGAPPDLVEALQKGDVTTAGRLLAVTITSTSSYSGPLPRAEDMMKYGEADPSAPGVILRSFEEQGLHRRSLEKEEAEDYRLVRRRGQWMCFILALAAISAGTACAVAGYPIAGVSIAVPTLLGVSVVGGIGMLWRRQ